MAEKKKEQAKKEKEMREAAENVAQSKVEAAESAENPPEAVEEQAAEESVSAADVNAALLALTEEKEEYKNALIRERADFENYKKRNAELSSVSYQNGLADAVTAILPVLDNFERALQAECADQAFVDGMSMIMRQLVETLGALGICEIGTDGQFDPNVHNAVMQVDEEGFSSNDIVETLQKGYQLKDRILRHAMVKVNK